MKQGHIFPQIVNVTDVRYRWRMVVERLEKDKLPILVVEHSTPKAVIMSVGQAQNMLVKQKKTGGVRDPLVEFRKKYGDLLAGLDVVAEIRKMRNKRWNLS